MPLVSNEKQTIKIRANQLITGKISKDTVDAIVEYAKEADPEAKEEKKAAAQLTLDPLVKAELEYLSVDLPNETVPLTQTLGSLLYDIYVCHVTEPKAPFAKVMWQKKNQGYVEELSKPEIQIPEEVRQVALRAMSSEDLWAKTVTWVSFPTRERDAEENVVHRMAQISSEGIAQFDKLLACAVAAVGPAE